MSVSDEERQKIINEYKAKEKEKLRQRMAALGRSRSPRKRRAVLKNIKKAQLAKHGKLLPAVRPRASQASPVRSE